MNVFRLPNSFSSLNLPYLEAVIYEEIPEDNTNNYTNCTYYQGYSEFITAL